MTNLLDPWRDAAAIAAKLALPTARLVVFIGAESWCERCRTLKPEFESKALQQAEHGETWIWLDLEEHAEFFDGFIPDDLPLLIGYVGPRLSGLVTGRTVTPDALSAPFATQPPIAHNNLPDIRTRLMTADWAV